MSEPSQDVKTTGQNEPPVSGFLYGEPLSREDSDFEADESKPESFQIKCDPIGSDRDGREQLKQAAQLISSAQMSKRLQPIVILKTAEPRNYRSDPFHCAECQHTTQNVDNLIDHYHNSHSQHKFHCCPTCNIYLTRGGQAEKHTCCVTDTVQELPLMNTVKQKMKRTPHTCRYCHQTFSKLLGYIQHMRLHTGKTPYRCSKCGSYFAQRGCLTKHQSIPGRCQGPKPTVMNKNLNVSINKNKNVKRDLISSSLQPALQECCVKVVDIYKTNFCYCGKGFTTVGKLKTHKINEHSKDKTSPSSEDGKALENDHITKPIDGTGKYRCPLCPRVFKFSFTRSRHLKDCLRDLTYGGNGKIGQKYPCPLCHVSFTVASNRHRHVKTNRCLKEYLNRVSRKAPRAEHVFKKLNDKTKQVQKIHENKVNVGHYKCTICPAVFMHASGKYRHMKKHELFKVTGKLFRYRNSTLHLTSKQKKLKDETTKGCKDTLPSDAASSNSSLTCRSCGKMFKNREPSHNEEKPYQCFECQKSAKGQTYPSVHKTALQRNIQCTVCRKILPTIAELFQHRKTHTKRGILKCPDCPMTFQYPVYLRRHLASGRCVKNKSLELQEKMQPKPQQPLEPSKDCKGRNQFQCSLCKTAFQDAQALRSHCLSHISKSSSCQCPFCKQNFSCRRYMLRHMHKHTGGKPLSCNGCGKRFIRKRNLAFHQQRCKHSEPKNEESLTPKKQMKCCYCPRVFTKRCRRKAHQNGHRMKTLIRCSKCAQFFGRKQFSSHEKNCNTDSDLNNDQLNADGNHLKKSQPIVSTAPSASKKIFQHICPYCQRRFKYRCFLLRHLVSHTRKQPHSCMHCGQKYRSKSKYLEHEAFCDGICKERSKNRSETATKLSVSGVTEEKQKVQADSEGEYKCKFCTKTFTKSRNLRRHILTHNEVKPYRCKTCDSCFSRYDHLKIHQTRCKGKRQWVQVCIPKITFDYLGKGWQEKLKKINTDKQQSNDCRICSRHFSNPINLSRHIAMTHTKKKAFNCTQCGSSFSQEKTLKIHKKLKNCKGSSIIKNQPLLKESLSQGENLAKPSHKVLNPNLRIQTYSGKKWRYACKYCPRFFKSSEQLRVHTRLHTGEKPFQCSCCGERFIRKDYLRRHSAKCQPSEDDLELCDKCGSSFSKENLKNHQQSCSVSPNLLDQNQQKKIQNPPKGFRCAYCNSRFLLFSLLQQHFIDCHKEDSLSKPPVSAPPLQQQLSRMVNIKEEPLEDEYCERQLTGDGNPLFEQDDGSLNTDRPVACPHCDMRFLNRGGLAGHMRTHSLDFPFPCKKCKRGFWNKNQQRNHFRKCRFKVVNTSAKAQSVATSTTVVDSALNILVFDQSSKTTGTGVLQTNFSCKDDPKDTPTHNSTENQEHKSSSTEMKVVQYQCSECDKSFTDGLLLISHLEDHGRVDLEKKGNTCPKCGKICTSPGFLKKHMKMHASSTEANVEGVCYDQIRQFICKICKHKCGNSQALNNHYTEAHPGDVYTCQICNKSYTLKKSLSRHYRMRHKNSRISKRFHYHTSPEEDDADQETSTHVFANEGSDTDNENESYDTDSDSAPYFPCHVCGKTFLTSESLEDHQRYHLGEKPHECAECGKCFFHASQLQQHQRAHKSEFQCQICGRGFVTLFALRKHKHSHSKIRPHRCSKCTLSFKGPSQLADHMATHLEDNFPCDICDRTFSDKGSRAEHRKTHVEASGNFPTWTESEENRKSPSTSSESSSTSKNLKYRCGVCAEYFIDQEELSEHGCHSSKERPHMCLDCNKYFFHEHHLAKHRATHHASQPYVYRCHKCSVSFAYRQHYINHLKRHGDSDLEAEIKRTQEREEHGPPSVFYKCSFCPEQFAMAMDLIKHMSAHSEKNHHECKICKSIYPSQSKLEEHERCHLTAATEYECTECGQSFLGSDAFRQHHCSSRQHGKTETKHSQLSSTTSPEALKRAVEEEEVDVTGEDFFNCHVCSKRFSSKRGLLEHQNKNHPNEQPFRCELCGKNFALRKYLLKHLQRHNKIDITKSFKCSQCPVTLETAKALTVHMRNHAEEAVGDHRCDMCYKSFGQLSHLRQHQESHVGQVVYECTECDKAFAFPHLLEKHQQTHSGPSL